MTILEIFAGFAVGFCFGYLLAAVFRAFAKDLT